MTQKQETTGVPTRYSHWYTVVVALFVTCLVTANIMSVKLINVFGLVLPAGVLIFPISYITGDVLTEVYGYTQARRVIWLGFFCNFIFYPETKDCHSFISFDSISILTLYRNLVFFNSSSSSIKSFYKQRNCQ